jgi:hypothetical protein
MNLQNELDRLLINFSKEEIIEALRVPSSDDVLSIIADGGMHRQPDDLLIGERYIFSNGMIDTTSDHSVDMHILECCKKLSLVLRRKNWSQIRLFYSGHSLLPAYAKLTVYRVTHLDTVVFGFFGEAGFRRIELSLRRHLLVDPTTASGNHTSP